MSQVPEIRHNPIREWGTGRLAPFFLAVILVFPLFTLPGPSFTSGTPWKVELLAGIYILAVSVWTYVSGPNIFRFDLPARLPLLRVLLSLLPAFVLWSGLSAVWADSGLSASHHTLVWAIYLIVFFLFLNRLYDSSTAVTIIQPVLLTTTIISAICFVDFGTLTDFRAAEGLLRIRYAKFAELLITVVPILWVLSIYARKGTAKIGFLIAAMSGWATVMLSLSKGAFIAGVIGFIVLFCGVLFFSGRGFRSNILKLAAVWLALTLAMQLLIPALTAVPSTSDYISGNADPTRTTSSMRVFTWAVGRQMAEENWLIGVGADNFGLRFNHARAVYSAASPDDPNLSIAEDYTVERAHNEFLQIYAELGVIGLFLVLSAAAVFAGWAIRVFYYDGFTMSPVFWGSLAGTSAFVISSLFSSFSFRAMQNGIAFFMVLALAVNELIKRDRPRLVDQHDPQTLTSRPIFALAIAVSLLMIFTSGQRLLSTVYMYRAERSATVNERNAHFERALMHYPENAAAAFSYGMRSAGSGDRSTGIFMLQKAIDCGLGTTVSYSLLAMLQEDSGDRAGAEATMAEAVTIYPGSIFARVRYGVILGGNGKQNASQVQIDNAARRDASAAAGWHSLITEGSTRTEFSARNGEPLTRPSELRPQGAVIQFTDEFRRVRQELKNAH